MPSKIIFYNHFHRGDLHTHKEFVKQIMRELPDFEFEYRHKNPRRLTDDYLVPFTGTPDGLSPKEKMYAEGDTMWINTWVGSDWDIFCKHGGINMNTLHEQWYNIFEAINFHFHTELVLDKVKENYLPKMNYQSMSSLGIQKYLDKSIGRGKMLICNNVPNSGQSFPHTMEEYILPLAKENTHVDFIVTNQLHEKLNNLYTTSEIIGNVGETDLLEISLLSRSCDVIVGKNSGPFVFCETYDNLMDQEKVFISFNTKNPQYDTIKETMSNGLDLKCKYNTVPIVDNTNLSDDDRINILNAFINI